MRIKLADADAPAIEGENLAKAAIARRKADLQVKKAEAYQLGETRKREAEAAVLEAQHLAVAKAALAEAERDRGRAARRARSPAKAEKAEIDRRRRGRGRAPRIEAEGEASAIFAKLEAEARGQYEILAKKGEGLQRDHRRLRRRPAGLPAADARTLRQPGRGLGQGDLEHQVRQGRRLGRRGQDGDGKGGSSTAGFLQKLASTLPPMLQMMRDIGGVEMPEFLGRLVTPERTGRRRGDRVTGDHGPCRAPGPGSGATRRARARHDRQG